MSPVGEDEGEAAAGGVGAADEDEETRVQVGLGEGEDSLRGVGGPGDVAVGGRGDLVDLKPIYWE